MSRRLLRLWFAASWLLISVVAHAAPGLLIDGSSQRLEAWPGFEATREHT